MTKTNDLLTDLNGHFFEVLFCTEEYDLVCCMADSLLNAKIHTKKWIMAFDPSLLDPEDNYGEFVLVQWKMNSIGTEEDMQKTETIDNISDWVKGEGD